MRRKAPTPPASASRVASRPRGTPGGGVGGEGSGDGKAEGKVQANPAACASPIPSPPLEPRARTVHGTRGAGAKPAAAELGAGVVGAAVAGSEVADAGEAGAGVAGTGGVGGGLESDEAAEYPSSMGAPLIPGAPGGPSFMGDGVITDRGRRWTWGISSNGLLPVITSAPLHQNFLDRQEEPSHEGDQESPAGNTSGGSAAAAPFPLPGAPGGPAFMGAGFVANEGTPLG